MGHLTPWRVSMAILINVWSIWQPPNVTPKIAATVHQKPQFDNQQNWGRLV